MSARYRVDAASAADLLKSWFAPMHEAIPELAAMGPAQVVTGPRPEEPMGRVIKVDFRRR